MVYCLFVPSVACQTHPLLLPGVDRRAECAGVREALRGVGGVRQLQLLTFPFTEGQDRQVRLAHGRRLRALLGAH